MFSYSATGTAGSQSDSSSWGLPRGTNSTRGRPSLNMHLPHRLSTGALSSPPCRKGSCGGKACISLNLCRSSTYRGIHCNRIRKCRPGSCWGKACIVSGLEIALIWCTDARRSCLGKSMSRDCWSHSRWKCRDHWSSISHGASTGWGTSMQASTRPRAFEAKAC